MKTTTKRNKAALILLSLLLLARAAALMLCCNQEGFTGHRMPDETQLIVRVEKEPLVSRSISRKAASVRSLSQPLTQKEACVFSLRRNQYEIPANHSEDLPGLSDSHKNCFHFQHRGCIPLRCGRTGTAAWHTGVQVLRLFGEPLTFYLGSEKMIQAMAVLLSDLVCLTADAILLAFAGRYFKAEQADGTPFTESGANLIRHLGILCIWMPIVAIVIASVITACLGAERTGDASNLPSVITGIVLILASLIFRYGAELEARNRPQISGGEKMDAVQGRSDENLQSGRKAT